MAERTGISWTDATVNFWQGCHKVSEGCKYCYMFRDKARFNKDGNVVVKTQPSTVNSILNKLYAQHKETKKRIKVFTNSYSDFFIEEAEPWMEEAWNIIRTHDFIDWQILTKRIDRAANLLPPDWENGWDHVWLGVSAENQVRWDERIPVLLKTPAKVRFVSAEPLLSSINIQMPCSRCEGCGSVPPDGHDDFDEGGAQCPRCYYYERAYRETRGIDWIILGGESGNETGPWKYRPAPLMNFHGIVERCQEAGVAVFVKQLGTSLAKQFGLKDRAGATMEEWPEVLNDLKIQQFPKTPFNG